MAAHSYFPPRGDRLQPALSPESWPFPLAVTFNKLELEMDRQEPIPAMWALLDAGQCLIRYSAIAAAADVLAIRKAPSQLFELLFKPSGLSLGDWHSILELSLTDASVPRRVEGLAECFFNTKGKRTSLNRRIDGDADCFVAWRNCSFGHGAFKTDRVEYAHQTLKWFDWLCEFYDAVTPIFDRWRLISRRPDGQRAVWHGAGIPATTEPHTHQSTGESVEMCLESLSAVVPFGPLLSVQQCAVCGHPAAFFFDRNRFDKKKDRHRTTFLEYFGGHHGERRDDTAVRVLAAHAPVDFEWNRTSYDVDDADLGARIVFRDFEEYCRPDYLIDAFNQFTDEHSKGYFHLVGPGGIGKTYIARGLEQEKSQAAPVVLYHVLPGARSDYRTFMAELDSAVRNLQFRFRSPGLQAKGVERTGLADEFAEYVTELMSANKIEQFVVVIDGLDELADPTAGSASVADFLPFIEQLPAGCFIVLTSRPDLCPHVSRRLDAIKKSGCEDVFTLALSANGAGNQELLRTYVAAQLPEPLGSPQNIDTIVARSGGIFLYAAHFCRALDRGAFADATELPDATQFYPAYLDKLRDRVGEETYTSVYRPVLTLLTAAYRPVSLAQLTRWGIPAERLQFALLDLSDFLREHRTRSFQESLGEGPYEPLYEIAHEEFVRWAKDALAERVKNAHRVIAGHALRDHQGKWENIDHHDDAEMYDLRFVLDHARASEPNWTADLLLDGNYADTIWHAQLNAFDVGRHHLALELTQTAAPIYETILQHYANTEYESPVTCTFAGLLSNASRSLVSLWRYADAAQLLDRALTYFRRLAADDIGEYGLNLIYTLMRRGEAHRKWGQYTEAVKCCDESIEIYGRLADLGMAEARERQKDLQSTRACWLSNAGQVEEARNSFEESIYDLRVRVASGDHDAVAALASALLHYATTLRKSKAGKKSLSIYKEAVALYRDLAADKDNDRVSKLAHALFYFGYSKISVAEDLTGIADINEAISMYRQLVDGEQGKEFIDELAEALGAKTGALERLGRLDDAVAACADWVEAMRSLVADGREDQRPEFLHALGFRQLLAAARQEPIAHQFQHVDAALAAAADSPDDGHAELPDQISSILYQVVELGKRTNHDQLSEVSCLAAIYAKSIEVCCRPSFKKDKELQSWFADIVGQACPLLVGTWFSPQSFDAPGLPEMAAALFRWRWKCDDGASRPLRKSSAVLVYLFGLSDQQRARILDLLNHQDDEPLRELLMASPATWETGEAGGVAAHMHNMLTNDSLNQTVAKNSFEGQLAVLNRALEIARPHLDNPAFSPFQPKMREILKTRINLVKERGQWSQATNLVLELVQDAMAGSRTVGHMMAAQNAVELLTDVCTPNIENWLIESSRLLRALSSLNVVLTESDRDALVEPLNQLRQRIDKLRPEPRQQLIELLDGPDLSVG